MSSITDPHETLYHFHLSDGTCVSTAICPHDDMIVKQVYPYPVLFTNRLDWVASTSVHYAYKKPFVIYRNKELERNKCCEVKNISINSDYDQKDIAIVNNTAKLALELCDSRI